MKKSATLNRLSESATLAMARKARELKAKGLDIVSLSLGEPDFNTPTVIKEAAEKAIENNYSHYTPVNGYLEVREAVSNKFKRDNGLEYSPEQIVLSTGAKQSIANVVLAMVSPGEKVLLPAPYWVSYSEIVKLAGGIPFSITTSIENDFKITAQQLEEALLEKPVMMIFSSPCNPSGSVYTEKELASLAEIIENNPDFYVISDEIYELINFEEANYSLAKFSKIKDQVITVNGVSKAFAMTGWRLGYIGASKEIAQAAAKIQGQITSAPSGISQMAAKRALELDPSEVSFMKEEFLRRRNMMLDLLGEIPGITLNVPEGAFYIFPNISTFLGKSYKGKTITNSNDLCIYLLEEFHIGIVAGSAFGNDNCVRISYASSEENLRKAAARIKEGLLSLV